MAENDQKTLDPTPKRLEDARRKGDVPSAPEMRHAAMFAAMFAGLILLGAQVARGLAALASGLWSAAGERTLDAATSQRLAATAMGGLISATGPVLALTMLAALAGYVLQGNPGFAASRLKLKWDRLSPMAGAKRLFGRQAWVEFGKMLAKFLVVGCVIAWIAWPGFRGLDSMVGADPANIGDYGLSTVRRIVETAALLVGALALFDLVYQRRAWFARQRMSHQEVRDEHKQNEGDPQIKARIRAIAMQRARTRMMAAVPQASVVITNPTHYAVALRYDHGEMQAPVVVAKGADLIAAKIRELAAENSVPIVESPPLARALHAGVAIGQPIKVEHYAAVAEIISYVMRVTEKRR